jgi:hypothetical protein
MNGPQPTCLCGVCLKCKRRVRQQKNLKNLVGYKERQDAASKEWKNTHPLYNAWKNLQARCTYKYSNRYEWYGERGVQCPISLCEFERVMSVEICPECMRHMTPDRHSTGRTIDRIDNDGDYTVENCRCICRGCNVKKSWRENSEHGHGSFGRDE